MSMVRAAISREEFAVTCSKNWAREELITLSCGSRSGASCITAVIKWMRATRDAESDGCGAAQREQRVRKIIWTAVRREGGDG